MTSVTAYVKVKQRNCKQNDHRFYCFDFRLLYKTLGEEKKAREPLNIYKDQIDKWCTYDVTPSSRLPIFLKILQERETAIIYNLACKEVFDDAAVELTMALQQYFNSKPNERNLRVFGRLRVNSCWFRLQSFSSYSNDWTRSDEQARELTNLTTKLV
ncbi:hypothetical protein Zmor_021997 [Zophobas morio]|uniref:Uncharacterized protein n=1 Tax=Zophobas morio TaxID=2755281 RepID=A0AA38MAY0_9CUCU|nr:hypothetical protein Zmor_021997 [Zophobas morio]